jgi:predicted HicB family RNase H-like nuclease
VIAVTEKTSFLYVKVTPEEKKAWTMAARSQRKKLAVWVSETLNDKIKNNQSNAR